MTHRRLKAIPVVKAIKGDTCLGLMSGARLKMKSAHHGQSEKHLITVVPSSREGRLIDRLAEVPAWVWEPARAGRCKVVFDASMEGYPHKLKRMLALHSFLESIQVPRTNAVYLTQDRGYEAEYRAVFPSAPRLRVLVCDYWVRAIARQHETDGSDVFKARLADYQARPRNRERRFLCLNRNLRASKALFLLRVLRDGLWDRGFISHGGLDERRKFKGFKDGELERELFRESAFEDLNRELAPLLPRLEGLGKIEFAPPSSDAGDNPILDQPLSEYGRSWFSVVTETEMRNRVLRITEKPFKALMNFHPFVVLGNPGSLQLLREYGFQSFPGMFDESYDEERDPRRRFEMVFSQVERLCTIGEDEIGRLDLEVEETVIHNARQALIGLPAAFHDRLDRLLVDQILAPADAA